MLSTRLVGGKPQINVYADSQPDSGFVQIAADLEDVYFLHVRNAARHGAAAPAAAPATSASVAA